jgi:hypothetical protein
MSENVVLYSEFFLKTMADSKVLAEFDLLGSELVEKRTNKKGYK